MLLKWFITASTAHSFSATRSQSASLRTDVTITHLVRNQDENFDLLPIHSQSNMKKSACSNVIGFRASFQPNNSIQLHPNLSPNSHQAHKKRRRKKKDPSRHKKSSILRTNQAQGKIYRIRTYSHPIPFPKSHHPPPNQSPQPFFFYPRFKP